MKKGTVPYVYFPLSSGVNIKNMKKTKLKSEIIYNHAENQIMVSSRGNKIIVICNDEDQMGNVQKRFYESGNYMVDYEEWDEEEDKKYIVTFEVSEEDKPTLN